MKALISFLKFSKILFLLKKYLVNLVIFSLGFCLTFAAAPAGFKLAERLRPGGQARSSCRRLLRRLARAASDDAALALFLKVVHLKGILGFLANIFL